MSMATNIDYNFLWNYLVGLGRFDLIDLLHKAENKKIHTIKIYRQLVPDRIIHNVIINFLKINDISIIEEGRD